MNSKVLLVFSVVALSLSASALAGWGTEARRMSSRRRMISPTAIATSVLPAVMAAAASASRRKATIRQVPTEIRARTARPRTMIAAMQAVPGAGRFPSDRLSTADRVIAPAIRFRSTGGPMRGGHLLVQETSVRDYALKRMLLMWSPGSIASMTSSPSVT